MTPSPHPLARVRCVIAKARPPCSQLFCGALNSALEMENVNILKCEYLSCILFFLGSGARRCFCLCTRVAERRDRASLFFFGSFALLIPGLAGWEGETFGHVGRALPSTAKRWGLID